MPMVHLACVHFVLYFTTMIGDKVIFMLVSLITLVGESVNMSNIDVFLTPLVEGLRTLWMFGVQALDFAKVEGHCYFNLRVMVMWAIDDFLGYGLFSECVHQGCIACLKCGPKTTSLHSLTLRKVVYIGHCIWLQCNHTVYHDSMVILKKG